MPLIEQERPASDELNAVFPKPKTVEDLNPDFDTSFFKKVEFKRF